MTKAQPDIHPIIAMFQGQAEVHDAAQARASVDDAMVLLATWMELAQDHLTADDVTVLGNIGGILYRDGLSRRITGENPSFEP